LLLNEGADRRRMQRQFWQAYLATLPADLCKDFEVLALGREQTVRAKSRRSPPAHRSARERMAGLRLAPRL
jgi:hypothetical protein